VRIPDYHCLSPWSSGRVLDLYRRKKKTKEEEEKEEEKEEENEAEAGIKLPRSRSKSNLHDEKNMMIVAKLDVPRTT